MKKLFSFFSIVLILTFIQIGCQNSEDVISPVADGLEKRWGNNTCSLIPVNSIAGEEACVELVAARNKVIGNVCVDRVGSNLKVTYTITLAGWSITKTHLAVVGNKKHFPQRWNGAPKLKHFPYKGIHENVTTVEYLIPINNLPNKFYVAAHAKVQNCDQNGQPNLLPEFPEDANMTPNWLPSDMVDYTVKAVMDFGTYSGFCVDNSRYIGSGSNRSVELLSSYDEMPECSASEMFIEKPENLDLINWIINNRQSNWDRRTLQAVIWKLINPSGNLTNYLDPQGSNYWTHNAALREEIFALAIANGEGFTPGENQKILVLVYGPGDICNPQRQVVGIEFPVENTPGNCFTKNAWGFPYNNCPVPFKSAKFGHTWARYFSYLR